MFDKIKQEAEKHVLHASQAYLQRQLYKEWNVLGQTMIWVDSSLAS